MLVTEGGQEIFPDISEALRYFGKSDLSSPRGRQPSPFDKLRAMALQAEDAEKDSRFHFKRTICSAEILGWISFYPWHVINMKVSSKHVENDSNKKCSRFLASKAEGESRHWRNDTLWLSNVRDTAQRREADIKGASGEAEQAQTDFADDTTW